MVVETRQARGTTIEVWGGGDLHAHGRPDDLATALQNLLVNAEVHAPGSPVVVHVSRVRPPWRSSSPTAGRGSPRTR